MGNDIFKQDGRRLDLDHPSLWWDNEVLSLQLAERLSDKKYEGKLLFLSIANPLPPDTEKDIDILVKDTSMHTEGLRATYKFSKIASEATNSTLQFSYKYYENENHGTIPLISIYDGMYFLYPWYKMSGTFVDVLRDPTTTTETIIHTVKTRYKTLSNHIGYTLHPEEDLLNN